MKFITKSLPFSLPRSLFLASALMMSAQGRSQEPAYVSYLQLDMSTSSVSAASLPPAGSTTSITGFDFSSQGSGSFANGAWSLPLNFSLSVDRQSDVQIILQAAGGATGCSLVLSVNGEALPAVPDSESLSHQAAMLIPKHLLKVNEANLLKLSADGAGCGYSASRATIMPNQIYAQNGVINTTIYAQFGETDIITGGANDVPDESGEPAITGTIWTRGYGFADEAMMIPAPTLYFKPGDLVNVNLINKLNRNSLAGLNAFENAEGRQLLDDEVLDNVADKIRQEVNIPHNLDNTNLHVHGLHVDPEKDDVTIVIIPDGETDGDSYDAPHHAFDVDELNEGSVADQPIKEGDWVYSYRIPDSHLPGTHWFHPHKHGSTAAQLENGMAGSLVIEEADNNRIIPPPCDRAPNSDIICPKDSVDPSNPTIRVAQSNYDPQSWALNHDAVLMIQEIANYGTQEGGAGGPGTANDFANPTVTVNGVQNPTFTLPGGQLQRWRLVNAGANHRAFAHLWLGEKIDSGEQASAKPVYQSTPFYLVAVDGITLSEKTRISAENPLLLAPGNRADILVQLPYQPQGSSNSYTLFKYFPQTVSVQNEEGVLIWDCQNSTSPSGNNGGTNNCVNGTGGTLLAASAPTSNPYLFQQTGIGGAGITNGVQQPNFAGFTKDWNGQKQKKSLFPLIKVKAAGQGNFLALDAALAEDFPSTADTTAQERFLGKWQPQSGGLGGGQELPAPLFTIEVTNEALSTPSPNMPSDAYLAGIHLKDNQGLTPAYVSEIEEDDIFQSRPVVFDIAGVKINVANSKANKNVKQFSLNGRLFALNDPIGNGTAKVNDRIQDSVTNSDSDLKRVESGTQADPISGQQCLDKSTNQDGSFDCELNIEETLSLQDVSGNWTNGVNGNYYWTNPGYYQSLHYDTQSKTFSFVGGQSPIYGGSGAGNYPEPDWKLVSGIDKEAIVNANFSSSKISSAAVQQLTGGDTPVVPGLPVAASAEEWILINNSDVGHPFHIHINPFFVVEVGQLSYEQFAYVPQGSNLTVTQDQWVVRAANYQNDYDQVPDGPIDELLVLDGGSAISHFVGNWWDTVIIPPHGYVKVRYWFNVPDQAANNVSVVDDANKQGIWVYHCHILRHEDRGMMMPIVTQTYPVEGID